MLDERKTSILRAVVQEYITTAQPVGSTHIADLPSVRVSSATVRNEMAVLEQEGYLAQPHTSAGRVPTDKGYRFFVDHITTPGRLDTVAPAPNLLRHTTAARGAAPQTTNSPPRSPTRRRRRAAAELATVRSVQIVGQPLATHWSSHFSNEPSTARRSISTRTRPICGCLLRRPICRRVVGHTIDKADERSPSRPW